MSANGSGDGHERCDARTRNGKTCKLPAGHGTDHVGVGCCKLHGGSTPTHEKAASVEIARRECETLGVPIETTPADALRLELYEASGNVAFYRQLVQELPTHPEPDEYIDGDDDGGHWERGEAGVYGRTYHVSGVPTGEAKPNILVVLYNQERDRLRAVSEAMLRANVEERMVRMAESDAAAILGAQVKALVTMGLSDRLEEFRVAFVNALRPTEPPRLGTAGGR